MVYTTCETVLDQFTGCEVVFTVVKNAALAREGDYEMMPVRACVCALVSHADFSKTATATDFL